MSVFRWAAEFLQLIVCCSCSKSGCLNLFRLFLLQIRILQFCFSDLLVYLNDSMFSLSSIFLYSSPMFCFSSNFFQTCSDASESDLTRWQITFSVFPLWCEAALLHIMMLPVLVSSVRCFASLSHRDFLCCLSWWFFAGCSSNFNITSLIAVDIVLPCLFGIQVGILFCWILHQQILKMNSVHLPRTQELGTLL